MLDVNKIRDDFPILKRKIHGKTLVYLDNAATTQKPKQVINALIDYYQNHNAKSHRGIHTLGEEATSMHEEAREKIARFIGAKSKEEIIFVRNTSEAINLVAYSWGRNFLKKGDEVILTEEEHHSNIVPWQLIAGEKKIKLKFIPVTKDGLLDINVFKKLLSQKTKLVSLMHISNVLGTINPVEEVIKLTKQKNPKILVLIDGAQAVPHMKVNMVKLACDFYAFSGHKMLGPTGIGILYGRKEILKQMPPFMAGGDMIREVYLDHSVWNDLPYKFEAGTPNIAGAIALGVAADYLEKLGLDNIFKHEQDLTDYALAKLTKIRQLTVYGPQTTKNKTGVISFTIKGIHPHDIAQILDCEGIAIRSGFHCAMPLHQKLKIPATCRASFYLYNTREDVDKLVFAIKKTIAMFV